ncbi:MAG: GNAT family N-acetyltransferase, partial [Planctomycetales bacterium]|nr:GNAT family N-acetyltransferase [Planctomycetales bacterium]
MQGVEAELATVAGKMSVELVQPRELPSRIDQLQAKSCSVAMTNGLDTAALQGHPSLDLRWLSVLQEGLGHVPYCIVADDPTSGAGGLLPLLLVRSRLFGRFLIGHSFLSTGGVRADNAVAAQALIDRAIELADECDVDYLELRHEHEICHPRLTHTSQSKVHCRIGLPEQPADVLARLKSKVRSQVRRGIENNFEVAWGRQDRLADFYKVFAENMRDLGTPVFGRRLFAAALRHLDQAELVTVSHRQKPIAAAMLVHGERVTEVPCASSLRQYNSLNVNMFM